MNKIKYVSLIAAAGLVASLAIILPVSAQTVSVNAKVHQFGPGPVIMHGGSNVAPGIFGTVTAINGDTLTVTSQAFMRPHPMTSSTAVTSPAASTTVYTVDASNATVSKNNVTSTLSSVAVNDMVFVQGTISGTNVTATAIRDGVRVPTMGGGSGMRGGFGGHGSSTSTVKTLPITGNGEPIVGGSITAISGDTLTVTNASNVTYSVDATNATIVKGGVTSTLASVATGDNVIVQGTVDGTSITASSVIDQGTGMHASSTNPNGPQQGGGGGIFGAIGSFFKHLFGF